MSAIVRVTLTQRLFLALSFKHMHTYTNIQIYTYVYIHIYAYSHIHTYAYIHIHTFAHTYQNKATL